MKQRLLSNNNSTSSFMNRIDTTTSSKKNQLISIIKNTTKIDNNETTSYSTQNSNNNKKQLLKDKLRQRNIFSKQKTENIQHKGIYNTSSINTLENLEMQNRSKDHIIRKVKSNKGINNLASSVDSQRKFKKNFNTNVNKEVKSLNAIDTDNKLNCRMLSNLNTDINNSKETSNSREYGKTIFKAFDTKYEIRIIEDTNDSKTIININLKNILVNYFYQKRLFYDDNINSFSKSINNTLVIDLRGVIPEWVDKATFSNFLVCFKNRSNLNKINDSNKLIKLLNFCFEIKAIELICLIVNILDYSLLIKYPDIEVLGELIINFSLLTYSLDANTSNYDYYSNINKEKLISCCLNSIQSLLELCRKNIYEIFNTKSSFYHNSRTDSNLLSRELFLLYILESNSTKLDSHTNNIIQLEEKDIKHYKIETKFCIQKLMEIKRLDAFQLLDYCKSVSFSQFNYLLAKEGNVNNKNDLIPKILVELSSNKNIVSMINWSLGEINFDNDFSESSNIFNIEHNRFVSNISYNSTTEDCNIKILRSNTNLSRNPCHLISSISINKGEFNKNLISNSFKLNEYDNNDITLVSTNLQTIKDTFLSNQTNKKDSNLIQFYFMIDPYFSSLIEFISEQFYQHYTLDSFEYLNLSDVNLIITSEHLNVFSNDIVLSSISKWLEKNKENSADNSELLDKIIKGLDISVFSIEALIEFIGYNSELLSQNDKFKKKICDKMNQEFQKELLDLANTVNSGRTTRTNRINRNQEELNKGSTLRHSYDTVIYQLNKETIEKKENINSFSVSNKIIDSFLNVLNNIKFKDKLSVSKISPMKHQNNTITPSKLTDNNINLTNNSNIKNQDRINTSFVNFTSKDDNISTIKGTSNQLTHLKSITDEDVYNDLKIDEKNLKNRFNSDLFNFEYTNCYTENDIFNSSNQYNKEISTNHIEDSSSYNTYYKNTSNTNENIRSKNNNNSSSLLCSKRASKGNYDNRKIVSKINNSLNNNNFSENDSNSQSRFKRSQSSSNKLMFSFNNKYFKYKNN